MSIWQYDENLRGHVKARLRGLLRLVVGVFFLGAVGVCVGCCGVVCVGGCGVLPVLVCGGCVGVLFVVHSALLPSFRYVFMGSIARNGYFYTLCS
jgi:hypothetical protein